jgi:chloramphenicol 3-O-phosphotransferase
VDAGLSSINTSLQELGETDWAICLDGQLIIMPRNNIAIGRVWFTWDSVMEALDELEQMAQTGAHLGNLDKVVFEIRKSKKLVAISATK